MPRQPEQPSLDLSLATPIVLLDIDGVINVFQCRHAQQTQVASYLPTLALLPDVHKAIQLLDHHTRIVWCSSWNDLANRDLATFFGITPKPVLTPLANEAHSRHWKALVVQRTFAHWHGKLAWIEDGFTPLARDWARQRLSTGDPTWLIDVTEDGLTLPITHAIVDWSSDGTFPS